MPQRAADVSTTIIRDKNDLSTQNAKKVEKRFSVDLDDISDFDIDNFDLSLYNKIPLSMQERNRLWSEAMKWDGRTRNVLMSRTLSNEYTYLYILDENNKLHVYKKSKMINIHERGNIYDKQSREKLNTAMQSVRDEQTKDSGNIGFERGSTRTADTSNNQQIQQERERYGGRYLQDGVYTDRSKERKSIVYFDDGKNERYSLDVETAEEEPSNRIARIQRVTEEQEPKTKKAKRINRMKTLDKIGKK